MGKIVKNGVTYSGSSDNADNVKYNNNVSNLDATNVQEAIDKLDESVDTLNSNLTQVQSQIVPTASIEIGATASKAYNIGDFLVKDGILYKVTKAIVKDDVLTVGTNIAMTTVGSELSEIKSNLSNKPFEVIATATKQGNVTTTKPLSEFNGFVFMLIVTVPEDHYPNVVLQTTFTTREIFEIEGTHLFAANETGRFMGRVKRVDDNTVNFFGFKEIKKAYLIGFY